MIAFPNAKINLGLNILSKREDGYHNISSVFYPVPLQDILEIIPAEDFKFSSSGLTIPGTTGGNLVVKAYHLLNERHQLQPVHIHLHKIIPMGAGLGGGSADGAFAIRLLNEVFTLSLPEASMQEYAARLGSDCPFFIQNKPVLAEGRGTEFSDIAVDLKGKYLVLICPDVHVSTAEAYNGIKPAIPERNIREIIENSPVKDWKKHLKNDFEASVFSRYPQLQTIKEQLYDHGALYASMTGSGSALYGLFDNEPDAPDLKDICWKGIL